MTGFRFTSSALAELTQATLHYEKRENGLGGLFLDEVDETVARILTNPEAWTHCLHEQDVAALTDFPLVLFIRFAPMKFLSFP